MGSVRVSLVNRVVGALQAAGVAAGDRVLVAVSGGVDSMVLLHVLARLRERFGLRLYVAHVHHGLRGRAADRDAAVVVAEAARLPVGVSVARLDPASRRRGESLQTWARSARYACLEAVAKQVRASWVLLAHTQDDQAETVLLNLLRGTGARGLAGIPPVRARFLRPLLTVSRADVEAYAAQNHLPFRTDASNASDAYRRNRIRHHLLPLLAKEYNPRIVESLAALAALVREDEAVLAAQAGSLVARSLRLEGPTVCLEVGALRAALPAVARRVFQEAFQRAADGTEPPEPGRRTPHGLTRRHLEALGRLLTRTGAVSLPGGLQGLRAGSRIRFGTREALGPAQGGGEVPLRLGAWTWWRPMGCRIRARPLRGSVASPIGCDRWHQILSPRLLEVGLSLRRWRPGDRFRPLGLGGRKKLQDFFVDAKVPRGERTRVPLLIAGGEIAWVIGYRIAEDFRWRGRGPACLIEVDFPENQPN